MNDQRVVTVLVWLALIVILMALIRQLASFGIIFYEQGPHMYSLPDAWGERYSKYNREGFEDKKEEKEEKKSVIGGVIDVPGTLTPADVNDSYLLAGDVLEKSSKAGGLTAKTCFEQDFVSHSDQLGNYIQRTNNFKHKLPDNCSAPLTEMVNSFYQ